MHANRAAPPATTVLVTGATGFVGRALCADLANRGQHVVRRALRRPPADMTGGDVVVGDIGPDTDWGGALEQVDAVVHLAARVHIMNPRGPDPLPLFRAVNTEGTLNLAAQAAAAGVRRLVFLSSVKVNGESTAPGHPFSESDPPAPSDAYGRSKLEAESGLREVAATTGMEVVVIRPPLVYGPGAKANFAALARTVRRGWPLPLGAIDNRRSLVALDNLVHFAATCITHPMAANQTFLVRDGEDLSTTDLVRRLAAAAGLSPRLLPVPPWMLQAVAAMLGKGEAVQRLCGNLQVDDTKARDLLGWTPPLSVDEGLRRAMAALSDP